MKLRVLTDAVDWVENILNSYELTDDERKDGADLWHYLQDEIELDQGYEFTHRNKGFGNMFNYLLSVLDVLDEFIACCVNECDTDALRDSWNLAIDKIGKLREELTMAEYKRLWANNTYYMYRESHYFWCLLEHALILGEVENLLPYAKSIRRAVRQLLDVKVKEHSELK